MPKKLLPIGGGDLHPERRNRGGRVASIILEGHYSSAVCHLPNLSCRLGSPESFDSLDRVINSHNEAGEMIERMVEQLKDENGLATEGLLDALGRLLELDPLAERFLNDDEANALISRENRAPFVVPEAIG